jgi:hypothetical protein
MIEIISFAHHHFTPQARGTRITSHAVEEFVSALNASSDAVWVDDPVQPFIKHVFVQNFTDALSGVVEVNHDNESLLRSGYEARSSKEIPVLTRWFPRDLVEVPHASHLQIVLYSREQLALEGFTITAEWGVVAILASMSPEISPPTPATQVRNALGIEGGGNGSPIDPALYAVGVAYWSRYALVR